MSCRVHLNDFPNVILNTSENVELKNSFVDMHLKLDLLHSIYMKGFERPSAIQQRAVTPMINGRNVLVQSETGTGKTTSFVIASLQVVDVTIKDIQIICMSPTGRLSQQVKKLFNELGDIMHVYIYCCLPGINIRDDVKKLNFGVHVVCGTPERLFTLSELRMFRTRSVKAIILDGVDEMIHMKRFNRRVELLYKHLPPNTQVILTSSTFPREVLDISNMLQRVPFIITELSELNWKGAKQCFIAIEGEEAKFDILYNLFNCLHGTQAVVFCNTTSKLEWLSDKMKQVNFDVCSINDDNWGKTCFRHPMMKVQSGICRVFVTTDSRAREIDMGYTSIIVNYDLPNNPDLFVQRIRRRFRGEVVNINFVITDDKGLLKNIEQSYEIKIEQMPANFADKAWQKFKVV